MIEVVLIHLRPYFLISSGIYMLGIFILPRLIPGSFLSRVWNPLSLLHIPLYGIFMLLLALSFGPSLSSTPIYPFHFQETMASVVEILDEIHQAYLPGREASVSDVMLDMIGIVIVGILIRAYKHRQSLIPAQGK